MCAGALAVLFSAFGYVAAQIDAVQQAARCSHESV
jgi:hypothetical protein